MLVPQCVSILVVLEGDIRNGRFTKQTFVISIFRHLKTKWNWFLAVRHVSRFQLVENIVALMIREICFLKRLVWFAPCDPKLSFLKTYVDCFAVRSQNILNMFCSN